MASNSCRCGCPTYRDHIRSIAFRAATPAPKQTVDVTDGTVNTVTEHWDDRQDVHIKVNTIRTPMEAPNGERSDAGGA